MSGWSIALSVPPDCQSEQLIKKYYAFIKKKQNKHCSNSADLQISEHEQRTVQIFKSGEFLLDAPVYPELANHIDWESVESLMDDDWIIRGDDIETLVSIFRQGTIELVETSEDPVFDYKCYSETGVVALCEFAAREGFEVKVFD